MNKKDLSKYLDTAIFVLILVILFLAPLFFDRRIGITFSLSKATWIRAVSMVLAGLWVLKGIYVGWPRFRRTEADTHIFTYLLSAAAATILSVNAFISLIGSYGRYEGLITLVNYAFIFFAATNFVTDQEKKDRIAVITVFAGVIMSIYGIIQRLMIDPYSWGGVITQERIIGTIGQPNFLAAYVDMAFFLGLGLVLRLKNKAADYWRVVRPATKKAPELKTIRWDEVIFSFKYVFFFVMVPFIFVFAIYNFDNINHFYTWLIAYAFMLVFSIYFAFNYAEVDSRVVKALLAVSLVVIFFGILSTQSRGGWMAFIAAATVFFLLTGREIFFRNIKLWAAIGTLSVLAVVISFNLNLGNQASRLLGEVEVTASSGEAKLEAKGAAGSRIETWTSTFGIIADNPVFGIGPEVIKNLFPRYETRYFRFREGFHVKQDRAHNEVLDMATTRGLVTLLVYILLIGTVMRAGYKRTKEESDGALIYPAYLAAMTAYLAQNQFSFGVVAITSLFWTIMGMTLSRPESDPPLSGKVSFSAANTSFAAATVVIIALLCYISSFPYIGDKYYKAGKIYSDSAQFPEAFESNAKAVKYSPYEAGFHLNAGVTFFSSRGMVKDQSVPLLKAKEQFKNGQRVDPYNGDNFYMSAVADLLLTEMGKGSYLESAETDYKKALTIDPFRSEAYRDLGRIRFMKGDVKGAIALYEKAFLANPTYVDIGAYLFDFHTLQGDPEKAVAVFEESLKDNPSNIELLTMIGDKFLQIGRLDRAEQYFNRALSMSPDNTKALSGLGMCLQFSGRSEKAFEMLQKALMIDPLEPRIHLGLARYFLVKGDKARAKEELETVIQNDKNNREAVKLLNSIK